MKNILIAEDNDSNYTLMTYFLRKHYTYDRARNGREAVDKVREGQYDLVLMDLNMPVMDGLEATRIIRNAGHRVPIVAVTANAFDTDKQRAEQAGCNAFLTKPFDCQQYLSLIAQLTGEQTQ